MRGKARRGEARKGKTHKLLMALDPMPTGQLMLVAPTFAQALMAKELKEAKKQMEHQKIGLDVNMLADWPQGQAGAGISMTWASRTSATPCTLYSLA